MYVRLLGRMLPKHSRIHRVVPLGSRTAVIEKCAQDQATRARRRLYIIDADQDLLRGRRAPSLKHLYRLQVYCSENLLMSERAIVTLGTESMTSTTWPDMAVLLNLRVVLEAGVEKLFGLCVLYAVIADLGLPIQTVGYSVIRLLDDANDPSTLSETKIRRRILSLLREISRFVAAKRYKAARNVILRRVSKSRRDRSSYISGKTYLLPLAHLQLRRVAGFSDSVDKLKVRIAEHCELSIDRGLKRAVRQALK